MLKIDPHMTFEATATIDLNALQATFGVRCKFLHIDRLNALRKGWSGTPPELAPVDSAAPDALRKLLKPAVAPTLSDREFIDFWLVGFADDVMDAEGNPLPFSPDNVTKLLDVPGAKIAVINAFFRGYEEAETKNLKTPPAGS